MSFPNCLNKLEVLSVCHMDKKQKEKTFKKNIVYRIMAAHIPCYLFSCVIAAETQELPNPEH